MHGEAAGDAACRPPLYSCHDGRCVPPTSLCDDVTDCQDGSDEGPLAGCSWAEMTPLPGDGDDKMPAGILALIIGCSVLAVVAAVVGILLLIYIMRRKKQRSAEADRRPQNAPDTSNTEGAHDQTPPAKVRSAMTNQSPATLQMTTRESIVNGVNPLSVQQSPAEFHGDESEIAYITGRITQNPPELGLHQYGSSNLGFIPRPASVTFGKTPEDEDLSGTLRSPSPIPGPEPPNLPSWKHVLTRSYPTHTGLARPSPSAPSLNALDRVAEAPSIGSLHHYPGTQGRTDVHSHSLPDVSYMSAFQKVSTGDITRSPANFTRSADDRPRSAGNFTRSMTNLTITATGTNRTVIPDSRPEDYLEYTTGRTDQDVSRSAGDLRHTSHMTYSRTPAGGGGNYSRSNSVPLSYPSEERSHYAVPLSVYKTPPPPRSVLNARHHDIRESFY